MEEEKVITLRTEDGEEVDLYVIEETKVSGVNYILVTDSAEDEEEGQCYVLKDRSRPEDEEAVYEFVDDDDELDDLFKIFSELISDMDLDLEH